MVCRGNIVHFQAFLGQIRQGGQWAAGRKRSSPTCGGVMVGHRALTAGCRGCLVSARLEVGRRRGADPVWQRPHAPNFGMVVSELGATNHGSRGVEGPRRKPSLVFHWTDSGYAFGRGNLFGALSRCPSAPRRESMYEIFVQFFWMGGDNVLWRVTFMKVLF